MKGDEIFQEKLEADERLIRVIRQYPWMKLPQIIVCAVLFFLPFFLLFPLFRYKWTGVAVFFLLLVFAVLVGIRELFIWRKSVFVVTTKRIIDVDQRGLLNREVSEMLVSTMQDVSFRQKGMFHTLFRCGTLEVQNAGAAAHLEMSHVHHPEEIQKILRQMKDIQEQDKEKLSMSEALSIVENVRARLGDKEFKRLWHIIREHE